MLRPPNCIKYEIYRHVQLADPGPPPPTTLIIAFGGGWHLTTGASALAAVPGGAGAPPCGGAAECAVAAGTLRKQSPLPYLPQNCRRMGKTGNPKYRDFDAGHDKYYQCFGMTLGECRRRCERYGVREDGEGCCDHTSPPGQMDLSLIHI